MKSWKSCESNNEWHLTMYQITIEPRPTVAAITTQSLEDVGFPLIHMLGPSLKILYTLPFWIWSKTKNVLATLFLLLTLRTYRGLCWWKLWNLSTHWPITNIDEDFLCSLWYYSDDERAKFCPHTWFDVLPLLGSRNFPRGALWVSTSKPLGWFLYPLSFTRRWSRGMSRGPLLGYSSITALRRDWSFISVPTAGFRDC